jgi:hypothetical protein
MENNYYIYVHRSKEGKTFYVGKGKEERVFNQDRTQKWFEEAKGGYWVEIIAQDLTEQQALFTEQCIIKALTPELVNSKIVTEVISPDRYKNTSVVQTPLEKKVEENYNQIKLIKRKLAELELTKEERDFLGSNLATQTSKRMSDDDLRFRSKLRKKLSKRRKLEEALKTL